MNRIPEKAAEVLEKYFSALEQKLPGRMEAFYVYGSISLGVFDEGISDIDFLAVMNTRLDEEDIKKLMELHHSIKKGFPKTDLMGMYVTQQDLQADSMEETCPCFIDGKFRGLTKFNRNSIDAWQIKNKGIALKGQGIAYLDYTVDWDVLIEEMRDNLNTYWVSWRNGCKRFPSLKFAGLLLQTKMVEWGVLGVSRLYYTFRENDMTSKVGAGEYALKHTPLKWHKIIRESMRLRKGIKQSYYRSIVKRRNDALDYIDFIISECNKLFKN